MHTKSVCDDSDWFLQRIYGSALTAKRHDRIGGSEKSV